MVVIQRRERAPRGDDTPLRVPSQATESGDWEQSTTQTTIAGALTGAARQALETGALDVAEGSARSLLIALESQLRRGHADRRALAGAGRLLTDLAETTGDRRWLEHLRELEAAARRA